MSNNMTALQLETQSETDNQVTVKRIKRFTAIYPVFFGFSADLLFWIAIDTLFLTFVKGLDASKIVFLTDFALIVSIALNIPIKMLIRKLGNTISVRVGALFSVSAALLLTFAKSYYLLLLGMTLKQLGMWFYEMHSIILKNNLNYIGRGEEFAKYQTRGFTIYSVFTAIIAFIASPMFNLFSYFPMLCCIVCTFIAFGLSFFIKDYSDVKTENQNKKSKSRLNYKKFSFLIVTFALTFSIAFSSQTEGKLFIQDEFSRSFSKENVVWLIGLMVSISRVVRIVSNIFSYKLYIRLKEKIFPILSALLLFSMLSVTLASFITEKFIQVVVMIFGYIIILFLRDPYKIFLYDFALSLCDKDEQNNLIMTLQFSYRVCYAVMLLGFSRILVSNTMLSVMIIFIALSSISLIANVYICVKSKKLRRMNHQFR